LVDTENQIHMGVVGIGGGGPQSEMIILRIC